MYHIFCSKYPGDPVGSCSSKELFACELDRKVIGCTHHNSNYDSLLNRSLPSITMVREPRNRSLSAYQYPGIHHNSKCKSGTFKCFWEYTVNPQWKNVAVKLFTGLYAYAKDETCEERKQCKHSLELAVRNIRLFAFIGISEMWELSMLLFHMKFPSIEPLLEDFKLGSSSSKDTRVNRDSSYSSFKNIVVSKYHNVLNEQSNLDRILYEKVVERVCQELHELNLWTGNEIVQKYWREKSPYSPSQCT